MRWACCWPGWPPEFPVAPAAAEVPTTADLVVQVNQDKGYAIADVTKRFALITQRPMVRSAGIYLVRTTKAADASNIDALIDTMTTVTARSWPAL